MKQRVVWVIEGQQSDKSWFPLGACVAREDAREAARYERDCMPSPKTRVVRYVPDE